MGGAGEVSKRELKDPGRIPNQVLEWDREGLLGLKSMEDCCLFPAPAAKHLLVASAGGPRVTVTQGRQK